MSINSATYAYKNSFIRKYINTYSQYTFLRLKNIPRIYSCDISTFIIYTLTQYLTWKPIWEKPQRCSHLACDIYGTFCLRIQLHTQFQIFLSYLYRIPSPLVISSLLSLDLLLLHSIVDLHTAWTDSLFSLLLLFLQTQVTDQELSN